MGFYASLCLGAAFMLQLYDPHVVDRAVFKDDQDGPGEFNDSEMQHVAQLAAREAWLLDDNVSDLGPELGFFGTAGPPEDDEESAAAAVHVQTSGPDDPPMDILARPEQLASMDHGILLPVHSDANRVADVAWPNVAPGPGAPQPPATTSLLASTHEPAEGVKEGATPEHGSDAFVESNPCIFASLQQMLSLAWRERADLTASRHGQFWICGHILVVLLFVCFRCCRRRSARARLRAQTSAFGGALTAESGEPVDSWQPDSVMSGFFFCAGTEGRLPPTLCRRVARLALEPRPRVPEEALERLPPNRRRLFALQQCSLGTPLAHALLAKRLGNLSSWERGVEEPLVACFPSGAQPWGQASHRGMLAIWSGKGGAYEKECPEGEPALKIPVAALTAVDCQNHQVRLEFSFTDSEAARGAKMRPAKLHKHLGTLLLLDFAEVEGGGIGEVAAFLQALHTAAREAGASYEATPGLPTQGAALPSFVYCRATRQAAELGWALLNLAFVVMPLRQIYKMGIFSLGAQGILGLIMSRPGEALKPVQKVASQIGKFNAARKGLHGIGFRDLLSRLRRALSARQA